MKHLFEEIGIYPKGSHNEQKVQRPKCSHERKNKQDPCLSIKLDKGLYNCHHCGWSGNVKIKEKKEYIKPPEAIVDLDEKVIGYFQKRGISKSTLAHWKVSQSVQYFAQVRENRNAINFNYYREGELINVKYRDAEKLSLIHI